VLNGRGRGSATVSICRGTVSALVFLASHASRERPGPEDQQQQRPVIVFRTQLRTWLAGLIPVKSREVPLFLPYRKACWWMRILTWF
jgi:hypothetical protein